MACGAFAQFVARGTWRCERGSPDYLTFVKLLEPYEADWPERDLDTVGDLL